MHVQISNHLDGKRNTALAVYYVYCVVASHPILSTTFIRPFFKASDNDCVAAIIIICRAQCTRRTHVPLSTQYRLTTHSMSIYSAVESNGVPCIEFNCQINILFMHCMQLTLSLCNVHWPQALETDIRIVCRKPRPWRSPYEMRTRNNTRW